jgi:hypothetical protein
MSRPDPIQYAERLYAAIVAANFSTMSFLAFGNAVKDRVELRRIPRIAAEPFMRVVGEMLEFEAAAVSDRLASGHTSEPPERAVSHERDLSPVLTEEQSPSPSDAMKVTTVTSF